MRADKQNNYSKPYSLNYSNNIKAKRVRKKSANTK